MRSERTSLHMASGKSLCFPVITSLYHNREQRTLRLYLSIAVPRTHGPSLLKACQGSYQCQRMPPHFPSEAEISPSHLTFP